MRRIAVALSVVALVGAGGPALAADPGAEVSPSSVRAGGSVTVSVTCEATGGTVAETIDATSQGFDDGTVQLQELMDVTSILTAAGVEHVGIVTKEPGDR